MASKKPFARTVVYREHFELCATPETIEAYCEARQIAIERGLAANQADFDEIALLAVCEFVRGAVFEGEDRPALVTSD